jgi:signal transduction histidine kinase
VAHRSEHKRGTWEASAFITVRVFGLGLTLWTLSTEVHPGLHGVHLGAWVLGITLIPPWIGWRGSPYESARRNLPFLAVLALGGGVLAAYAPVGYIEVGVAALASAIVFDLPLAAVIGAGGPVTCAIAVGISGRPTMAILAAAAATLAGLMLGSGRRQSIVRAAQLAQVSTEHERAELEQARADVLAERNRLAREVHDVLAHTLGALSVQLEALGAQAEAGGDVPDYLRQGLERTRALAVDGLDEARSAVRALRDDAETLPTQIRRLCDLHGASLSVQGSPRRLSPEATHALYRAAQESLTNAAKHAPDAPVTIELAFEPDGVTLQVANGPGAMSVTELAGTGGGFGLDGIRERIRLLGGDVGAGPSGEGWTVTASVPQ